jgi:hypothetical protein
MVGLIIIIVFGWLSFEIWRAPQLDNDGNVIKPTKKFKDIFKW